MRIGIISDIHGNYEALSALPKDYDGLWVLGDLVNYGPQPLEVVDFVRQNASVVIRGSHDHAVGLHADPRCSGPFRKMAEETMVFSESVLPISAKEYLGSLPASVELEREGTGFYLCHAQLPIRSLATEKKILQNGIRELRQVRTNFLIAGHTHVPGPVHANCAAASRSKTEDRL